MAFDPVRIPQKLKDAYKAKRCAAYVGAGASNGAGLPMWNGLLELMIAKAQAEHTISDDTAKQYLALLANPAKYLPVASGLKEDLGAHFDEFIEETFIRPRPVPTGLHHALVGLSDLQFVITTNYDVLIERAYQTINPDVPVCSFTDVGETQRRLSRREFFILKAHGDASKPGNGIVLTDADYRNILYRQRAYQSLLSTMFTMFTLVFVGTSMTDPELLLLLNYIADSFSPTASPCHFALLPQEDINDVEKKRWFRDFNVQVVPISKAENYKDAIEFLEALNTI